MTHHAAVYGGKNHLKILVLVQNLLFISAFQCHVNSHAYGSHNASIKVKQRGLVGRQRPEAFSRLYDFLGFTGFPLPHNLVFRFDADRIVLLHIPDIGVPLPLHLLPGFSHGIAKTVVYLLVNTCFVFKPYKIGAVVNGHLQKLTGFPEIPAHLTALLPALETKGRFLLRHGQRPYILYFIQAVF